MKAMKGGTPAKKIGTSKSNFSPSRSFSDQELFSALKSEITGFFKEKGIVDGKAVVLDNAPCYVLFKGDSYVTPVTDNPILKAKISKIVYSKFQTGFYGKSYLFCLNGLTGQCQKNGKELFLVSKVLRLKDAIYYNPSSKGNLIKITAEGYSILLASKQSNIRPLLNPDYISCGEIDGSVLSSQLLENMSKVFRLPFSSVVLLTVCLLGVFAGVQIPIIYIKGPSGSGKSVIADNLINIFAPSMFNNLVAFPSTPEKLVDILGFSDFVAFDNCSEKINEAMSNKICQAVTGGSEKRRKLYTDGQCMNLNLKTNILFTSTKMVLSFPDALSRTIVLNTIDFGDKGDCRKSTKQLKKIFGKYKPKILGGIFSSLCEILKSLSSGTANNTASDTDEVPRLTDFYNFGICCSSILGIERNEFTSAFKDSQSSVNESFTEKEPVLKALRVLLSNTPSIEITAEDLLGKLKKTCSTSLGSSASIPCSASALSRYINSNRNYLAANNISCTNIRTHSGKKLRFEKNNMGSDLSFPNTNDDSCLLCTPKFSKREGESAEDALIDCFEQLSDIIPDIFSKTLYDPRTGICAKCLPSDSGINFEPIDLCGSNYMGYCGEDEYQKDSFEDNGSEYIFLGDEDNDSECLFPDSESEDQYNAEYWNGDEIEGPDGNEDDGEDNGPEYIFLDDEDVEDVEDDEDGEDDEDDEDDEDECPGIDEKNFSQYREKTVFDDPKTVEFFDLDARSFYRKTPIEEYYG